MIKQNQKDTLFAQKQDSVEDFVFDENVANVFNDMINRSVPGYKAIINMIGIVAGTHVQAGSQCYDLGCSLGASTLAMRHNISHRDCRIIAVDNSPAMIERCRQNIEQHDSPISVDILCDDIRNVEISNASMVVLNFTLQFIPSEERGALIQSIYDGLCDGGVLLISEKIAFENLQEQELQTQLHHTFKKQQGYSDLEISQKRTALDNVLVPDTMAQHQQRLSQAGFKHSSVWFQCFNFASVIAFK